MQAKGLPVEYYNYLDEGHGFARWPNKLDFYLRADKFLAKHLGGLAEPFLKVDNSSVDVIDDGDANK